MQGDRAAVATGLGMGTRKAPTASAAMSAPYSCCTGGGRQAAAVVKTEFLRCSLVAALQRCMATLHRLPVICALSQATCPTCVAPALAATSQKCSRSCSAVASSLRLSLMTLQAAPQRSAARSAGAHRAEGGWLASQAGGRQTGCLK